MLAIKEDVRRAWVPERINLGYVEDVLKILSPHYELYAAFFFLHISKACQIRWLLFTRVRRMDMTFTENSCELLIISSREEQWIIGTEKDVNFSRP